MQNYSNNNPGDSVSEEGNKKNNKKGFWQLIKSNISDYLDLLLVIVSIWVSLILFFQLKHSLPELSWPFFLDELLFFILIFLLCSISVIALKPIVIVAIIISSIYVSAEWILHLSNGKKNAVEETKVSNVDREFWLRLSEHPSYHYHILGKVDSLQHQYNLLRLEHERFKKQFDSVLIIKENSE